MAQWAEWRETKGKPKVIEQEEKVIMQTVSPTFGFGSV